LMLAATWSTAPEDATVDAAGDDAAGAGEDPGAEGIGTEEELPEEELTEEGDGTGADGEEDAATAEVKLPAEGKAVLDEPQAVIPTARTTAAAGTNMDRRNIRELSIQGQVREKEEDMVTATSGVIERLERRAKLTA